MFNNKSKDQMEYDQNIAPRAVSENKIEAMDVEVTPMNPNDTETNTNQSNAEFGFENDDEEFEEYSDDDESRPCGTIEFKFEGVSRFEKGVRESSRHLSQAVKIRCLPWKILLLFNKDDLGIFVQCNGECESNTWNCSARAKIELISQTKEGTDKTNMIHHVFTSKENDWGYRSFIKLEDLGANGYILNDTLFVRARIEAEAPHGADWDSKKHTGFVGLKNQGATCYLNSLLQTLYFTNKLRKAVFLMPTESDDSQTSVPLALQRVFYELQFTNMAVGTKKLTRSFGWATLDSFMQHDAQELCRVLLDNLENKMKGTSVEDVIPSLFCGKMLSYIRCKHVNYESKREENFYDIQLKVKGNSNVYEAFREYIAVETLDNENQYDAGEYGMQPAEKGVTFIKFPPVLYLQLMRFQYDYQTDMNVKINDRFEFPYRLNVDEFLYQKDPNNPVTYFLHAVLVHSGDNHGGHYVVFLNPRGDRNWYEFDDDVVSRCERKAAIQQNYGSSEINLRSSSNAYMLVYIAESMKDDVLCPVEERDIPDYLLDRFREENRVEELKFQEKRNAHLFTMVHLLLEEDFYGYGGPGLFISKSVNPRTIRVLRESNQEGFLKEIAEALKRPSHSIKIWKVMRKKEDVFRLVSVANYSSHQRLSDDPSQSTFFVQFLDSAQQNENSVQPALSESKSLIFFKYFDRSAFDLRYIGMVYELGNTTFEQLKPRLNQFIGLSPTDDVPLLLFRHETNDQINLIQNLEQPISRIVSNGEVVIFTTLQSGGSIESLNDLLFESQETAHDALKMYESSEAGQPNGKVPAGINPGMSFHTNFQYNDIFRLRRCLLASQLEAKLAHEKLDDLEATRLTIRHYIEEFPQYVEVLLVDKNRPTDPGILLTVRHTIGYWEFARSIGKLLGVDPHFLQFFRSITGVSANQVMQAPSPVGPQVHEDNSGKRNTSGANNTSSGQVTGNESTGTPSPGSIVTSLLSSQMMAAKASGFNSSSSQTTTLLATAANQGLAREPPGQAILTSCQTLQKYLYPGEGPNSMVRLNNMSQPQYPQSHQAVNLTTQALLNGDRMPYPISRFSGSSINQANSLGSSSILPPRRVYYSHLSISIEEQETMRNLKCVFVGPKLTDSFELTLSVPQNGTVNDLLNEARFTVPANLSSQAQSGSPPTSVGPLRLLEVQGSKVIREIPSNLSIKNLQTNLPSTVQSNQGYYGYAGTNQNASTHLYRIEEIPQDEIKLQHDQKIVWISHVEPETFKPFGVPFSIPIKNGEHLAILKERIRKRLEVSEKEFEKWKLIYQNGGMSYLPLDDYFKVELHLFETRDAMQPHLLIEHKPAKRVRYPPSQKPIKIHN